ncbi:MAG: ATP-binding protein, partial [Clostridia bacterium]|nr:ATP-binding protein [Clostridia bacterium]
IDTAISKNIQHSLDCFERGKYFSHLLMLYEAGELTSAINRIIEDMNHRFVLSVLTKDFKSHDLGVSASNLRKERDPEKRTDILDIIDRKAVTERLMKILDIRNREQLTVPLTDSHVIQVKQYLKALDLIVDCPIEHGEAGIEAEEHILFVQPGMRYCQAQALVHSLMKDDIFRQLDETEKNYVAERILEEVRGRMMEDMILLETAKALGKKFRVFKLQYRTGEYDMVIYDIENNRCAAYEIKHSREYVPEQARHLRNPEMLASVTPRYGELAGRYVLYLGEDMDTEEGIAYRNAGQFLKSLPEIDIVSRLEEMISEDEDHGFDLTM